MCFALAFLLVCILAVLMLVSAIKYTWKEVFPRNKK